MYRVGLNRRRFLVAAAATLAAALAAACGAGPAAIDSPPTGSGSGTTTSPGGNLVVYTDAGYSPATLTIKSGDTVVFRNESSGEVWVASNPHPVHTDYPGFDSKKPLAKGEEYSFTFEKTGRFGYHNHLNPSQGATIVVQ